MRKVVSITLAATFVFAPTVHVDAYSGFGTKQSSSKEEIVKGVNLVQERYVNGKVNRAVQVLDVAYRDPSIDLELYQLTPLGSLKPTSQHAVLNTYEGHYVVGAMNASFYDFNDGFPMNMLVQNNEIIRYGILAETTNSPVNAPYAFGVNRNGALTLNEFKPEVTMIHNGREIDIHSVNGARKEREAVLYTSAYNKKSTGASQYVTEIVVTNPSKSAKNFSFGDKIEGEIAEVRRFGEGANATIPEDGFVISANGGPLRDELASVQVGDKITVEAQINHEWKDAKFMLATGPTLVRNGQVSISMNEDSTFASARQPRSAVGMSSDGTKLFFVTIDGRQDGYSNGATMRELAEYMKSIGAHEAINLDGGGSTTMVARLPYFEQATIVNRPSDPRERSVPTTLQVISTEAPKKVTEPALVVDAFESVSNWTAAAARAEAKVSETSSTVRVGKKALQLDYDYTKGEAGIAAAYAKAKQPIALKGRPLELGLWANGDGAEHWLRATVVDGAGQKHTVDFTKEHQFNWKGWQYVRANLPKDVPQPFTVEQLYIAQGKGEKQGKGTVYFDQLEAIYQSSYEVSQFTDLNSDHWAFDAINRLNKRGVINGYSDGSFGPADAISREQTAIMIARALDLKADNHKLSFSDVPTNYFYEEAIAAVDRAGIMTGKTAKTFNPKETLTRAEMALILQRAYDIQGVSDSPFPDVDKSHWAYEAIDAMKAARITTGQPNGGYGPALPTTRAEFSVFLDRTDK